jgi:hypothetical protein
MPKEVTHWLLAESVLHRCRNEASHLALDEPFALETVCGGASYHDVFYYVPRKRGLPPFSHVSDFLHGSRGENTFAVLYALVKDCINFPNHPMLPTFLLGVITHICADVAFHPFIYWASGNWRGKESLFVSQRQHRALESMIDHLFLASGTFRQRTPQDFNLRAFSTALHRNTAGHFDTITAIAARHEYFQSWHSLQTRGISAAIRRGYNNLALARTFCHSRIANALIRPLEPHLSLRLQSFTALRYAREQETTAPFGNTDEPFSYLHPVYGTEHTSSLRTMFQSAEQESVRVWKIVLEAVRQNDSEIQWLKSVLHTGASLEHGVCELPVTAMQHFSDAPMLHFA